MGERGGLDLSPRLHGTSCMGQPLHDIDQMIDFGPRVVQGQRRSHCRLVAEAPQNGLRAMVTGTHCDTFLVERLAEVLGAITIEHEGQHAGLVRGGTDQMQAGEGLETTR